MRPISHLIAKPRCKRFRPHRLPPATPAEPAKQAAPAKKPVEPKPAEPARASAPPAPAAPAAPPAAPTAQQKAAVRASCRSDFMSHCSGVQPGGAEALQCLKRNEAQLSAACRERRGRHRRRWRLARQRRLEHRPLRRHPRSRQSGRCRCCARARRWRSCKFAALKCGRSVPAFRSAAAVSSVASPQTHRACRRAVTAR